MIRPQNRSRARALGGVALTVAALLGGPRALAQPATDPAAAAALFKEARTLVDKGDYARGCPKFQAAFELSPTASILISIARCHEHDGKVATAVSDYGRALVLNHETAGALRQQALADVIHKALQALEPRVPKLRISIASPPPGLRVTRDGIDLPLAALGTALPLDPGTHAVEATAPGRAPEHRSVVLEEGKTASLDLTLVVPPPQAPLQAPVVAVVPTPPVAPTPPPVVALPRPPSPAPDRSSHAKGGVPTWAWVAGGSGVVLVGVGVFFLADNQAALSALHTNCPTDAQGVTRCAPGYDYASDNARKDRDVPLYAGLGGVGIAALGASIWGIATAPRKTKAASSAALHLTPIVGRYQGRLVLEGGF